MLCHPASILASRSDLHLGAILFLSAITFVWPPAASAQTNGEVEAADNPLLSLSDGTSDPVWSAFAPPPDSEFDWIQLESGEWLKGELKALYSFELEFDSDEMGLQEFDWEDVRRVRTAGPKAVLLEDATGLGTPTIVFGVLTIVDGKAYVGEGIDPRVFDRDRVVAIAVGTGREVDRWSGDISLGVNLRGGNSDIADATFSASIKRRRAISRLVADYLGNYSRTEEEETSNNHRLDGYYDIFASTRLFWRPVAAMYYRDRFKNIEHRAALGAGVGYEVIRTARTEWDITGGIGALYNRFDSVVAGQDEDATSPALSLGTRYDTELSSAVDYLFDYSLMVVEENSGQYIHHLVTTLSTDLLADVDMDVSLIWDRIQEPQASADGVVPGRDDYQLIFALSYEF